MKRYHKRKMHFRDEEKLITFPDPFDVARKIKAKTKHERRQKFLKTGKKELPPGKREW